MMSAPFATASRAIFNGLNLTDGERTGVLHTSHKGLWVPEGEPYCARFRGQNAIEKTRLPREAPSYETDPKGLLPLSSLPEICQLTLEPRSVTVAGAQEAEAARLRNCDRKSGIGHEIHCGKHNRMLNAEQPGYGIADRHLN